MVTVLTSNEPDNFASALTKHLPAAIQGLGERREKRNEAEKVRAHQSSENEKERRNRLLFEDKKQQKEVADEDKKIRQEKAQKDLHDKGLDELEKHIGKHATNLIKALPYKSEAQSKVIQTAVSSLGSAEDFNEMLRKRIERDPEEMSPVVNEIKNLIQQRSAGGSVGQQPQEMNPTSYTQPKQSSTPKTQVTSEDLEKPPERFPLESQTDFNKRTSEWQKEQRQREIDFHKESADFDKQILSHEQAAKKQQEVVKDLRTRLKKGTIQPKSWANVLEGLGPVGDKMSEAFLNGDEAALKAQIPYLLEGWKEVFGVRLSDADLKVLQSKLPSIGKSPEANESILDILDKYSNITLQRGKVASEIVKENNGIRPRNYARLVDERFDAYTAPVRVKTPNGRTAIIPAYQLGDALKSGATIINE